METLKNIGCPGPCKKVEEEPEVEHVPETKEGKEPQVNLPNKKIKKKKVKGNKKTESNSVYKAGDFMETFKAYVKDMKATGMSHAASLKSWNTSDVRTRLLADMPLSEKKKRRFVWKF